MASQTEDLLNAIALVQAGQWDEAHQIAQRHEGHAPADWLHAILHKIEGDASNSRYWYARTGGLTYETFSESDAELDSLAAELKGQSGGGE